VNGRLDAPRFTSTCLALLGLGCWLSAAAGAQTCPITVSIDATRPGYAIPTNYVGLSISSWSIDGDSSYTKCFTTANSQMVNLFKQIGIRHVRTIMNKADPTYPDPSNAEIDAFFDFAAAAGVNKVIWSLHLYNADANTVTNWSNNKAIATHIWNTTTASGTVEKNLLESFAFDNESDWLGYICCADPVVTGYYTPTNNGYINKWKGWYQTISAVGVAAGASFSGPDTGCEWPAEQNQGMVNTSAGGYPFTLRFAIDARTNISLASQHYYGESSTSLGAEQMAEDCLSPYWLTNNYRMLANGALNGAAVWPTNSAGSPMPYRFTECSAFNNGGGNAANHIFATALWALDFYYWWAQQGCAGVDPFTRTAQYNSPIFFDGANYVAAPYAYALKAFGLGSRGNLIPPGPFALNNPSNINLTAYAVVNPTDLYVTLINKTFNAVGASTAQVSIPSPAGFVVSQARYLVMSAGSTPGAFGEATNTDACLGGALLPNDGSAWAATWTNLAVSGGAVSLPVLPTTAVVLDLQGHLVPQLRLGTGPLQLSVSLPAGSAPAVLQASTNLVNWQGLYTNLAPFTFTDALKASFPARYYRTRVGP
jgi:hypothetical protein